MDTGLTDKHARELPRVIVDKPWGQSHPAEPFAGLHTGKLGEVWFDPPEKMNEVLVKYLFTSEKLSVQVHPSDELAPEGQRGKEECWYVLSAEPGASVALGLNEELSAERLHDVASDGTIENYLAWHEVRAGDFMEITPGTIHAIGGGLSILEVQQNCDITYRLYDYGRPRALHLTEAIRCATTRPYDTDTIRNIQGQGNTLLLENTYYTVARLTASPDAHLAKKFSAGCQIIALTGDVILDHAPLAVGQSMLADDLSALQLGKASSVMAVAQNNG